MKQSYYIVGIGELLWDLFPDGSRFGGAPVNFACHAAALGANVHVVTGIGNDPLGRQAREALQSHGVSAEGVAIFDEYSTGRVDVVVDAAGKATFSFAPNVAWDHLSWSPTLERLAARCDAVCFGTLGQRSAESRRTIQQFVRAPPSVALRIFDINLRPPYYSEEVIRQSLDLAKILKLNDDELPILASLCDVSGTDVEILNQLSQKWNLKLVALTRGSQGAMIVRGSEISNCPGLKVAVKDTVGAGDAFTAALVLGLLRNDPLELINRRACEVAAYVCSCSGATPPLPDEIRKQFAG